MAAVHRRGHRREEGGGGVVPAERRELRERQGGVARRTERVGLGRPCRERLAERRRIPGVPADEHAGVHGAEEPVRPEPELEGAAPEDEPVEGVNPGHEGDHRLERRGLADGRRMLGEAEVGQAVHPNLAIGVWQPGCPGDGVLAVVGLGPEGVPVAVGGAAPPRVLDDHDVAAAGGLDGIDRSVPARRVLVVGEPRQQHRPAVLAGRPVDVGAQDGPVAHRGRDVEVDGDGRLLGLHADLLPRDTTWTAEDV